jgi:3-hydroxyisobutyrate dehydrogenase-like beta-hydroxyacid dehydrogenase
MKVAFIGVGRMGAAMARRALDAQHEVAIYNRTPGKAQELLSAGAKPTSTVGEAANFGDAVVTMLADDVALRDVMHQSGGLLASLPKGTIHICAGTHSVAAVQELKAAHAKAGQVMIASPMLGRPEAVAGGTASVVVAGPAEAVARCRSLFEAMARRVFEAGTDPVSAAAIKIANNFVLGCAIEAMGEGFSLVRKYAVKPDTFYDVLTEGLFSAPAYKTYGKIIAEEKYQPAGQRAVLGLKDANLALAAAETAGVPLPSGNVWRDRLVGAVGRGEAEHDWAVMAKEQARASGLS